MGASIINRFWNASPRSIVYGLRRRLLERGTKPNLIPRWVEIQGGPLKGGYMYLALDASGSWQTMAEGKFDQFMFDWLQRRTSVSGKSIWDIGSHFGYHSLCFATLAGTLGKVVAFEPNPFNRARLQMNVAQNPELSSRITIFDKAVSNIDGSKEFVFSDDLESAASSCSYLESGLPPLAPSYYERFLHASVPTIRMDTLLTEHPDIAPDIIKIDVEGAEQLVLDGGDNFLTKQKPIILMEVHHILLMFSVQQMLSKLGYTIEVLDIDHASSSRCFIVAYRR